MLANREKIKSARRFRALSLITPTSAHQYMRNRHTYRHKTTDFFKRLLRPKVGFLHTSSKGYQKSLCL